MAQEAEAYEAAESGAGGSSSRPARSAQVGAVGRDVVEQHECGVWYPACATFCYCCCMQVAADRRVQFVVK